MIESGLMNTITLTPEEVGKGRRTVTIYVSPFSEEKHINACKKLYLNRGGRAGTKKVKTPVSNKKWATKMVDRKPAIKKARQEAKELEAKLEEARASLKEREKVLVCDGCGEKYPGDTPPDEQYCESCVEDFQIPVKLIEGKRDNKPIKQCPDCKKVYGLRRNYCQKENAEGRLVWDCTREVGKKLTVYQPQPLITIRKDMDGYPDGYVEDTYADGSRIPNKELQKLRESIKET
jgi:hypothetical protein